MSRAQALRTNDKMHVQLHLHLSINIHLSIYHPSTSSLLAARATRRFHYTRARMLPPPFVEDVISTSVPKLKCERAFGKRGRRLEKRRPRSIELHSRVLEPRARRE